MLEIPYFSRFSPKGPIAKLCHILSVMMDYFSAVIACSHPTVKNPLHLEWFTNLDESFKIFRSRLN